MHGRRQAASKLRRHACPPAHRHVATVATISASLPRADEELEEQDVDIENQYYNSKGLLESEEYEEALAGFNQVLKMEGEDKGEW